MKNGKCPRCGSENVHSSKYMDYSIGIAFCSSVELRYYACADCGYVETYVPDRAGRSKVAAHWPRVKG